MSFKNSIIDNCAKLIILNSYGSLPIYGFFMGIPVWCDVHGIRKYYTWERDVSLDTPSEYVGVFAASNFVDLEVRYAPKYWLCSSGNVLCE